MFGLTKLFHAADPETTLDKLHFLIHNTITNSNRLTAIISFSALFALIALRYVKNKFQGISCIYRLPEVLIVVVASTSLFYPCWHRSVPDILLQFFPLNSGGRNLVSIFLVQSTYRLESPSSNSLLRALTSNFFEPPRRLPCSYSPYALHEICT